MFVFVNFVPLPSRPAVLSPLCQWKILPSLVYQAHHLLDYSKVRISKVFHTVVHQTTTLPGTTKRVYNQSLSTLGSSLSVSTLGSSLGVSTLGSSLGVSTLGSSLGVSTLGSSLWNHSEYII